MDVDLGPFIYDIDDFDNPTKMKEHTTELAYHFWVKHGKPEGRSEEFWRMAEIDIIKQKHALIG